MHNFLVEVLYKNIQKHFIIYILFWIWNCYYNTDVNKINKLYLQDIKL